MSTEKTENELLKDEIERLRQERDQWRAQAEKLSLLFEAERDYWMPLVFRLNGCSLEERLDDYDNLKERLAGNMAGWGHLSDKLQTLRQVAEKFWAHADPNDPTSHPKNSEIESHLVSLGWGGKSASSGASIIRPSWGRKGRPDKI